MYVKEIKEILALMNDNGLSEIEIERDGLRIKLKKSPTGATEQIIQEIPVARQSKPASIEEAKQEPPLSNLIQIKSPMVGTFYRAPSPDAAPFIKIGDNVDAGQLICIIEAMKLMNEIKSEVKGRVVQILAEDADPVEFGQVIFLVEPNKA